MPKREKIPINPKIIEWCIQDLNISIPEVAKKTGVKPEKVESWINGTDSPTYKQVEKLAYKVFKKPLAVFFMTEIPESLSVRKKFRTLPEYLFESTSYKTRLAINKADSFKNILYELYKTNTYPDPIFKTINANQYTSAIQLADKIREDLGISYEVQKNFGGDRYKAFNFYRNIIEQKGIYTFQLKLQGDRAFCLLDSEFPVIVVNSGDSINSKIFSLFHELVHILKENEDIFKNVEPDYYLNDPIEVFCNEVASEVLVPVDEFKIKFVFNSSQWSEEMIRTAANSYCVSNEVIMRKLLDSGYVTAVDYDFYKSKWDEAYKSKKSGGGDFYLSKVSALGRGYVNKVISDFRSGLLNDVQVSNYLDIKYSQLPGIEAEIAAR